MHVSGLKRQPEAVTLEVGWLARLSHANSMKSKIFSGRLVTFHSGADGEWCHAEVTHATSSSLKQQWEARPSENYVRLNICDEDVSDSSNPTPAVLLCRVARIFDTCTNLSPSADIILSANGNTYHRLRMHIPQLFVRTRALHDESQLLAVWNLHPFSRSHDC